MFFVFRRGAARYAQRVRSVAGRMAYGVAGDREGANSGGFCVCYFYFFFSIILF